MTPLQVRTRAPMSEICTRLGQTDHSEQDWLVLSKVKPPPPHKEFFPRPPKRTDGSYVYDRIPSLAPEPVPASRHQMLYKKRPYEEKPVDTPSSKPVRTGTQTRTYSVNQVAPKGKFATMARVSGGQKTVISWQDAPDDLFYRASKEIKKVGISKIKYFQYFSRYQWLIWLRFQCAYFANFAILLSFRMFLHLHRCKYQTFPLGWAASKFAQL